MSIPRQFLPAFRPPGTAVLLFGAAAAAIAIFPASARTPAPSPAPAPASVPAPPPPDHVMPRVLPPVGDKISGTARAALSTALQALTRRLEALPARPENADAEVFLKAVRYALANGEFYQSGDAARAQDLLAEAGRRLDELAAGRTPWRKVPGLSVRGYYSPIDGSAQPFGLEIPPGTPESKAPAWFWLQGRGDKRTDLHFIAERLKKPGEFQPPGTIVIHPWGRYCLGYKGPAEQDVLDVRALLVREGLIDPERTALAGFSMGGAGAWLLGAHHPDLWAAVHTGAGFVDVRRYQNYSPDRIAATPSWERALWGLNDVPDYVRNLLNVPVISYSGEKDAQRAAAEIMAGMFQQQGAALIHLIGPGMGHKYDPAVRQDIQNRVQSLLLSPAPAPRVRISLQTRTLAWPRVHWLAATGLAEHWQDSRADASLDAPPPSATRATITTSGLTGLTLGRPGEALSAGSLSLHIDGQILQVAGNHPVSLIKKDGTWLPGHPAPGLRKKTGLQGPIDDAFNGPFLFVLPDRPGRDPALDAWTRAEAAAQTSRWRTLFRGDLRAKPASAVTPGDIQSCHLVLWGDDSSNSLLARALPGLPLEWTAGHLRMHGRNFPAAGHLPVMIYPNPLNPERYLVLNSGPTFREAHSKTNSQQNPKLPDWAVLDITGRPTPEAAGEVRAAGFFDESWKWKTSGS